MTAQPTLKRAGTAALLGASLLFGLPSIAQAVQITVSIDGSDAIFLAGRTDLAIPDASLPWGAGMLRHPGPTPEEILETLPPIITVAAGDVIRVADPATGGISFFNGFGAPFYGPDGGPGSTDLSSFGGISGYLADGSSALTGVFLDSLVPAAGAPARLDFTDATGIGRDFLTLMPELGEVFFIGDGITGGGIFQEFTAPTGATRLALGVPDGFGFGGVPGAYDDNDGGYRVRVGINEVPTITIEPTSLALLSAGLLVLGAARRSKRS